MTFRWFLYYCAIWGAVAGLGGWALGRIAAHIDSGWMQAGMKGMALGLLLAVVLVLVDLAFNGLRFDSVPAVLTAGGVGGLGGFVGGTTGQLVYGATLWSGALILGWTFTGLLIGAAPGLFGLLARTLRGETAGGDRAKVLNGMLGGTVGGLLGGWFYLAMDIAWSAALGSRAGALLSPSATGFAILGACIGLLIGLAQVILKEAWIKVEAGFRAGRELILTRAETTVGRAEGCDIALFGDAAVEKTHARILSREGRYLIEDANTPGGTFVNGMEIHGAHPLQNGDRIQIGKASLRFSERARRAP